MTAPGNHDENILSSDEQAFEAALGAMTPACDSRGWSRAVYRAGRKQGRHDAVRVAGVAAVFILGLNLSAWMFWQPQAASVLSAPMAQKTHVEQADSSVCDPIFDDVISRPSPAARQARVSIVGIDDQPYSYGALCQAVTADGEIELCDLSTGRGAVTPMRGWPQSLDPSMDLRDEPPGMPQPLEPPELSWLARQLL